MFWAWSINKCNNKALTIAFALQRRNHVSVNKNLIINCGNIFLKNSWTQEFIFAEKGLFEISENKNPLKITRYMVLLHKHIRIMSFPSCYCREASLFNTALQKTHYLTIFREHLRYWLWAVMYVRICPYNMHKCKCTCSVNACKASVHSIQLWMFLL